MPFQKGYKGGPGRPKGSKDRLKWQRLQTCWDEFMLLLPKLTDPEKAKYWFRMVEMHFEKTIARIPVTPDESVANAKAAYEEMKSAEQKMREIANTGTQEPRA